MRLLTVFAFAFFTLGLLCQVTYSAEDNYIDAKEYNIVTGSRYYKDVKAVEITSRGKSSKGTTITVNDTTTNVGEKKIDGKAHLVTVNKSTLSIGDAKPMIITSYNYYDLDGNFEYSLLNELSMKRVAYDKDGFTDKMLVGKKYYNSNKNSDGSIELTEIIVSRGINNITINSKSYMIKDDVKSISCEAEYVLQPDGAVKRINRKLSYPNEKMEFSSENIKIVTQYRQ